MCEREAIKQVAKIMGGQARLAEALGISQGNVGAWCSRIGKVSPQHALPCHLLTKGEVSVHDLRPDLYPRDHIWVRL